MVPPNGPDLMPFDRRFVHTGASAKPSVSLAYRTSLGCSILGQAEDVLSSSLGKGLVGNVDLIFTSPPFPLNRKKKYGNYQGEQYVDWLSSFASRFRALLKAKGSIVIELGNAWEPGRPIMSTLALRALLAFVDTGQFALCQQFIWHNPARLPSPAQWVNVERIRVKDAYTHLWWLSTTDRPFANNRQILTEYSPSMKELLAKQSYNTGKRPSQHHIGKTSFLTNNAGAIPSNVITMANTHANTDYQEYCREHNLQPHPARMPIGLAEFFIKFLSEPGSLVLDPFAGSNTTGAASQRLGRRWFSIEPNRDYVLGSVGRFDQQAKLRLSRPRAGA
jgi:DNA modification methylase